MVEDINELNKKIKEMEEKNLALAREVQDLRNAGQAEAGAQQKKEETPKEYKDRILREMSGG